MQNHLEEESQHCHSCAILQSLSYVGMVLFYVNDMHLNKTWNDFDPCERLLFMTRSCVLHTSMGYCSPSIVCSDPGPPFLPQCRWSCSALYVAGRFPPLSFILSGKSIWTRKRQNYNLKIECIYKKSFSIHERCTGVSIVNESTFNDVLIAGQLKRWESPVR